MLLYVDDTSGYVQKRELIEERIVGVLIKFAHKACLFSVVSLSCTL